jgi:hypothetical protein
MTEALAEVLGLDDLEFEIYKDYQDHGFPDGDLLMRRVKHEAQRRREGKPPITGAALKERVTLAR